MFKTNPTILWDFEGTLVTHPGLWRLALKEAMDECEPGNTIDVEELRPFLRTGFPWHNPEKPHLHLSTPDAWWSSMEPIFSRAYQGVGFDINCARELAKHVRKYIIDPQRYFVCDDAVPALENLKAQGWKHAILSNHVPELPNIVKALGLSAYIDFCISSAYTGYEKPNLQAFRTALSIIGNPKVTWLIGDNLNADIRGAEAAGIPGILVRNNTEENVKYFAHDLIEATAILESNV
jgi:FMN phosphatase YigB (HAD superfamily)